MMSGVEFPICSTMIVFKKFQIFRTIWILNIQVRVLVMYIQDSSIRKWQSRSLGVPRVNSVAGDGSTLNCAAGTAPTLPSPALF